MRSLRLIACLVCLSLIGAAAGCGKSRSGSDAKLQSSSAQATAAPLPYALPAGKSLDLALAEIRQHPAPAGLDASSFESLRAALLAALEASRSASQPPDPGINVINDLVVTDLGGGAAELSWTYRNRGDYDLNGEVNISDLTPVGQHFGKNSAHPQWDAAQKADGDGNGEINIADVTPIGQAYGAQCAAFNLYGSDSAEGPFGYLDSLPFASGEFSVYPPQFTWTLPVADKPFYLVAPADGEGFDNANAAEPRRAIFNPGTLTEVTQATIGVEGGNLDGPAATPLEGVHIDVPAGAFPGNVELVLSEDSGTIGTGYGEWEAPILDVETGLTEMFDEPLSITMPYTGGDDYIPVPYYIDDDGGLDACQITAWDPVAGSVTFETWHTSRYTIIKAARQQKLPPAFATSWEVGLDGFQVQNQAGTYTGGNCWGMSAWARWYWDRYSREGQEPVFFPEFMQVVNGEPAQQTIAMRAQLSLNKVLQRYSSVYLDPVEPMFDDEDTILIIRSQLLNTQEPVLLHVQNDDQSATHAVLAYAYGAGSFRVYDPNSPGAPKTITYDEFGFEPFVNFFTFTRIRYLGTGSLQTDSFDSILADAKAGFPGGEVQLDAMVNRPGGTNEVRIADVYCTVTASPVQVDSMRATVVDPTGTAISVQNMSTSHVNLNDFRFSLPLHPGENKVYLETFAKKPDGQLVKCFNSMEGKAIIVPCTAKKMAVQASLTYITNERRHDVELAILDSAGSYYCPGAAGGGFPGVGGLQSPWGFGPIRTLTVEDTDYSDPLGKPYRFRAYNTIAWADFDVTLTVSLNDGPGKVYKGHVMRTPFETSEEWQAWWPPDPRIDAGQMWWDGPTVIPPLP